MDEPGVERKLAAILAADMVGYSGRMSADEERTLAALNASLQEHIRPAIARCKGRIVKTTGDGVLAEFASALDAARCAVDIQEAVARRNAESGPDDRLSFRIGVNLGDVIVQDGDIFGNGVNVAARLEGIAPPGGICISGDVYRQVRGTLDRGFEDLGERAVKNIPEPVRVYRVLMDGDGAGVPEVREGRRIPGWTWPLAAVIAVGLASAAGWFALEHFRSPPASGAPPISAGALPLPEKPSIAILPFANLGSGAGHQNLGDGLAENLIASLSSLPGMFVIARSSSFSYRGKDVRVQDVAAALGVRYVLEGSVQVSGARARITARLVDAADDRSIWSQRYDREISDIFELQDELTLSIVTALQIELTEGELARTRRRGTNNLEAWLLVSESLDAYMLFTKDSNARARRLAEKALALDPDYPEALIRLARTYLTDFQTGWVLDREAALKRSVELVQQALSIDDSYPDAYVMLGAIFLFLNRHDDAIAYGKKAIELSPSHSFAYAGLAMIENYAGEPETAISHIKTAMRLSPSYPDWFLGELGRADLLTGRNGEAIDVLERRLKRNPASGEARVLLAAALGAAGRTEKARRTLAPFLESRPGYTLDHYAQGEFYRRREDLERVLDGLRKAGLED